jgi:anthranilate phosphoribosyltransferase
VVLNAAAAIAAYLGNFELSLYERMSAGIEKAVTAIDSGAAATLVKRWAELSAKIGL